MEIHSVLLFSLHHDGIVAIHVPFVRIGTTTFMHVAMQESEQFSWCYIFYIRGLISIGKVCMYERLEKANNKASNS